MAYVLIWWLLVEILGLAVLPIAYRSLRWLPDRGYTFSKTLGLLITSYLVWIGATTGFLHNSSGGILFAILAVFGISIFLLQRNQLLPDLSTFLRRNKRLIILVEVLFTLAFISWVLLRAYSPDKIMSAGGEKFMEIAFLNGVLNSPQFPPLDPWLSGFSISYYYFGYVMMGLLTLFSGAPASIGFELYDALLFALVTIGAFGIVYNLVASASLPSRKKSAGIRYGLLGALLVAVMGNLEGFLEVLYTRGILPASFWRWIDIPGLVDAPVTGGWLPAGGFFGCCWRASRVLQDYDLLGQPVGVSPITEFPMFSFLLGDNHPHVLALPFVLLLIAMAFNLLLRQFSENRIGKAGNPLEVGQAVSLSNNLQVANPSDGEQAVNPSNSGKSVSWSSELRRLTFGQWQSDWPLLLIYAFCIGALGFLNTWDMPIYLGLITLVYGLGIYAGQGRIDWKMLLQTAFLATSLLVGAILLYIFFYLGFSSQAGGILPYTFRPTRLPQYLVMFGVFLYIIIWFLIVSTLIKSRQEGLRPTLRKVFSSWGWTALVCLLVILFFLAVILLFFASGLADNPLVRTVTGGASIGQSIQQFMLARLTNPWLFLLLTGLLGLVLANLAAGKERKQGDLDTLSQIETLSPSKLFVLALIFTGIVLTLSVELFYLRDSFGVRMNTVFKFYYQAWIMLACASAYAVWWLLNQTKNIMNRFSRVLFLSGAVLMIATGLVYPFIAGYARVNGLRGTPNLDGASNLALANPDDWAAIAWLQANSQGTPVILEAPGKSYNYEGRISAFSGLPAVLGWAYHEAQWRGNYDEQGQREPDIATIYSTKSPEQALDLLRKWEVKYVIVGPSEINYIQQICSDPNRACNLTRALRKFDSSMNLVFQQGDVSIYEVPDF